MAEQGSFGRWLKQLRVERDLTQEMLAELVGCAASTVRSFEIGKRRPSRAMSERLVMVLKLPTDQQTEFLRLARLAVDTPSAADPPLEANQPQPDPLPPLPKPITPFIGRQAEQAVLCQLIQQEGARLVTLLGAGGMGKTRLALAVAHALSAHFPDGVGFVTLAALEDGQHLPATVAHALNIPLLGARDPAEQIVSVLLPRKMLLILDNFEHLLRYPQAVLWLNDLLMQATGVHLLITSRERLRIAGERVFALDGLTLVEADKSAETSDALLLFVERAQATAGDFVLNPANQTAIERICHLVGGMPLGIELAATWISVLNPAEIAAEIERTMDFLARADRDRDPRHYSMRAVFDHSWSLLNTEERSVLAHLAVFRGGCRREAATAVTGATLPILAALLDKSLLRKGEVAGSTRYDLHALIRQYAAQHLAANPADNEAVLRRHGEYYCRFVAAQNGAIGDQRQRATINQLQDEIANIRQAWEWAVQNRRGDLLYSMGRVMWIFCEIQNTYNEGEALFTQAAAMAQALRQKQADEAPDATRKANDLLFGRMTTHQAYFVARLVRPRQALTLLAPALAVLRQYDDWHTLSQALWTYGRASWIHGDLAAAEAKLREGLVIAQRLQFPNLLALYHTFLGAILHESGQVEDAYQHLQQALAFARQQAEPRSNGLAIAYLHQTALALGRGEEVALLLAEALRLARAANDWYCVGLALEQRAMAHVTQDNAAQASADFSESLAIFRKIGDLWSQSRLHTHLGHLALRQPDLDGAEAHFQQAVQIGQRVELLACTVNGLAGLARLAAQRGQPQRALILARYLQQQPGSVYATQVEIAKLCDELVGRLSPAEQETVQTRVAALSLDRLVGEFAGQAL